MSAPQKIVLDKDKILLQIEGLADIAKKDSWIFEYDSEIDELVFGKDYMPRDSFLFNVNEEINIFLSPDSTVNGLHIEYFKANFLEHNIELKPVLEAISNKSKSKDKASSVAKRALETELVADTFKSLFSRDSLVTAI